MFLKLGTTDPNPDSDLGEGKEQATQVLAKLYCSTMTMLNVAPFMGRLDINLTRFLFVF